MKTLHTLRNNPEESPYIGGNREEDTVSGDGRYVSEEEYWEKYYSHPDFSYEWNNGYLEEKPMSDFKGSLVYQWFCDILRRYFRTFPVGSIVSLEIGFRLALPGDISIRKPDIAVVLNDNPAMLHLTDCNFEGIFDLCIESLSYSKQKEIIRDTVEKKKEYQGAGVKEYYILDAREEETAFYHLSPEGRYRKIRPVKKDIIRSQVLPGFQFRISDLYRQPSLEEMADDGIYSSFVLPFHRQVRLRAEQSESQLVSERRRAEQAEQRAALLEDKLKELGISV
jgi:Uma2 family endonuclease